MDMDIAFAPLKDVIVWVLDDVMQWICFIMAEWFFLRLLYGCDYALGLDTKCHDMGFAL